MAFASKLVLVSLLLVVFLMINIKPSLSQSTQQLIEKICRSTEDYGFCRRTFQAHLKSPNANIVDLTQITLEVATDHATKTHEFIRQTLETARDPALKNALTECENAYGLIMHAFDLAVVSFFFRDYKNIEKEERVTPRAEASCEASLYTPPNKQKHIMDERSREMRIFIGMSLVSAQELVRPRPTSADAPAPAPLYVTPPSKIPRHPFFINV